VNLTLSITNENIVVIQWGVVIGASLAAAFSDLKTRRISNSLTFPLFLSGLVWAAINGGLPGLGQAFLACLMLGVPYVLLFVFAGGGAGDAKLMGAIGTWLGIRQSAVVLLCVACVGLVMAIIKAIIQGKLKFVLTSVFISFYTFIISVTGGRRLKIAREHSESIEQTNDSEMPYGIAICAGVCLAAAVVWRIGVDWLW
jgi:prepilin peptidase CpaA